MARLLLFWYENCRRILRMRHWLSLLWTHCCGFWTGFHWATCLRQS